MPWRWGSDPQCAALLFVEPLPAQGPPHYTLSVLAEDGNFGADACAAGLALKKQKERKIK